MAFDRRRSESFLVKAHYAFRHGSAGLREGQIDQKRSAMIRLAGHLDESVMVGDDSINHRKTEAGASTRLFGGKEGLENPLFDGFIYAGAGIRDANERVQFVFGFLKPVLYFV